MNDSNLSAHHVGAAALWLLGLGLIVYGLLWDLPGLGQLGLLSAGAGGILNVRGFVCHQLQREREAFNLGQESAHLRQLH